MEFSNLKGLSTQGMVGATAAWVDPSGDRSVLMGLGPVAGFMPKLDEFDRARLLQPLKVATDKASRGPVKRIETVQETHPRLLRTVYRAG